MEYNLSDNNGLTDFTQPTIPDYHDGNVTVKKKGFNSSFLKILAITVMLIDHAAVIFLEPLLTNQGDGKFLLYLLLRFIGRLGFPIFAFMIAEGARKTRSIPKYMLRLLIFGIISEIPFDLGLMGSVFYISYQNVYFTLLLGLMAIWCLRSVNNRFLAAMGVIACYIGGWALCTDYGSKGVLCIVLFYIFAQKKKGIKTIGYIMAIVVVCITTPCLADCIEIVRTSDGFGIAEWIMSCSFNFLETGALLSLIFILKYNGERGVKMNKYFFYGFYPGHILLLYLIRLLTYGY